MPDFERLNDAQRKAVTWEGGPLLVLAGPGSGKTHTIVKRISYLLEKGISPEQILVITFTREAAVSMQRRFQESSKGFRPVNFGTFHSVFYHILKESHYLHTQRLLKLSEKINFMLSILKKFHREDTAVDELREDAAAILGAFSYYKNTFQWEEAVSKAPVRWHRDLGEIYGAYEAAVRREGAIDFDDMLFACKKLLEDNAAVREIWQKRFPYMLIDEFQDINPAQYEIVRLMATPPYHIFAVGDDDQSIYGFRGSGPECLKRFEEEFAAHRILLDINYRSGQKIVEASLAVMAESKNRFEKQIRTGRPEAEKGSVTISSFAGKEQERDYLLHSLEGLRRDAGAEKRTTDKARVTAPATDGQTIAVLFRTNSAMQGFAAALRHNNIPYRMKEGNKSIYEHFIVKDMMAYLLLAEGKNSRELLLRIMNKPYRQISREITSDEEAASNGMRQLKRQLDRMKEFAPQLAVSYVLKAVGYERYLRQLSAGKPGKWQDWQTLLEWLRCDAAGYSTASEWQEAQRLYKEQLERERALSGGRERAQEEGFAVQLMTVHASKGLEFDYVFIPDCNEGVFPYGHMPDVRSVEEERRILYVAMTRAKSSLELLYLTGTEKSPRPLSRFLNPLLYSSSTNSSNSQLSRYSSKASATFSYSASSSI